MADQKLPFEPEQGPDDLMNPKQKKTAFAGDTEQQAAEPAPPDIIIEN